MKYIEKGTEPDSFTDWKQQENENWQPTYANLQNPQKRELHLTLLEEQGWACCYCGRSIELEDSHIEHFRPQEHYSALELAYTNLHASCIRATNPGTPLHCGHAKGSGFDEEQQISPLDEFCEKRFTYTLNGQILPKDPQSTYMCALLKLDIPFLRDRRAAALKIFDIDFLASVSDEELQKLSHEFKSRSQNGRFTPFSHVVAGFAEQLLVAGTN